MLKLKWVYPFIFILLFSLPLYAQDEDLQDLAPLSWKIPDNPPQTKEELLKAIDDLNYQVGTLSNILAVLKKEVSPDGTVTYSHPLLTKTEFINLNNKIEAFLKQFFWTALTLYASLYIYNEKLVEPFKEALAFSKQEKKWLRDNRARLNELLKKAESLQSSQTNLTSSSLSELAEQARTTQFKPSEFLKEAEYAKTEFTLRNAIRSLETEYPRLKSAILKSTTKNYLTLGGVALLGTYAILSTLNAITKYNDFAIVQSAFLNSDKISITEDQRKQYSELLTLLYKRIFEFNQALRLIERAN